MTLGELWDKYLEIQSDKVRINTRRSYHYAEQSIKLLFNIKCSEFNIAHYDKWKEYISGITTMNTVTKNDKLKVLKTFLNFGEKRYGYNFHQVLLNMERFKNPDDLVKEKVYYDINEFDKFLSAETDERYKILWETLNTYSHFLKRLLLKLLILLIELEIMLKNSTFLDDVVPKVAPENNFIIFNKNKRLSFPLYY